MSDMQKKLKLFSFGIMGFGILDVIGGVLMLMASPMAAAMRFTIGSDVVSGNIAAEVIGLPDLTIGEHLYDAKVYLDTPDLFAWTVAIVVVSVALEALVGRALDAALARWEARP